jgi:hypothetical protein
MVTIYEGYTKNKEGNLLHEFRHFLFGGLAEQPYQIKEKDQVSWIKAVNGPPEIAPSNELVEVHSRFIEIKNKTKADHTTIKGISIQVRETNGIEVKRIAVSGIKPLPRRDHSALLISSNRYMLIYGGKNDLAYESPNATN